MVLQNAKIAFRHSVEPVDCEIVRQLAESTGFFRADEVQIAVELVMERIRDGQISTYQFLFAQVDGQTVGYTCFGEIPCTIGSYDLYWIVVDSRWQGQGFGQRLIRESEAAIAAQGGRRIYIETSGTERYEPTRTFYKRCGYALAAELADFYSPGDNKLIYVKALESPGLPRQ